MKVAATVAGLFVVFAGVTVFAQQASLRRDAGSGQERPDNTSPQGQEGKMPLSQKRDWLRDQMLQEFSDVNRRAEIVAKVAEMSPERVDALVKIYQKREERVDEEKTIEARRERAMSPARAGGRSVGYAPVITWLPEGTSLGASAVVSPDRRYVRMSLQPFFSHIPRVDTFNFYTGQTRTYYPRQHGYYPQQYGYPHHHGYQPNGHHGNRGSGQAHRPRQPRTYHDGVRTRTEY
jgi:hypothetical protein